MDMGRSRYLVSPNTYFEVVLYANPGTKLNFGKNICIRISPNYICPSISMFARP